MPKIIIAGNEHDAEGLMTRLTINELYVIRMKTGMGMNELSQLLAKADALNPDSPEAILAFQAVCWVGLRRGDRPTATWDDAGDLAFEDLTYEDDEQPAEGEDTGPKAPTPPSGPVAAKRRAPAKAAASSRTSKPRS